MSLTFPDATTKKPSAITGLPSAFKRPAFGTLYGFDASGGGGGGGGAASGFNISIRDTESNIFARAGDAVGTIAFGSDTENLYVFDGTNFQIYENT